jgi:hypothetical protein
MLYYNQKGEGKMATKKIVLDMDGTIANLYGVEGWLDMLLAKDTTPYEIADPIYEMDELNKCLIDLKNVGFQVAIVSWCAKNGDAEYNLRTKKAKIQWLKKYNVPVDEIHIVKYGTPKSFCIEGEAILIDDEASNRREWCHGDTIDANKNFLKDLKKLLDR